MCINPHLKYKTSFFCILFYFNIAESGRESYVVKNFWIPFRLKHATSNIKGIRLLKKKSERINKNHKQNLTLSNFFRTKPLFERSKNIVPNGISESIKICIENLGNDVYRKMLVELAKCGSPSMNRIKTTDCVFVYHANICGFCLLYSWIFLTTFGVATLGLEPPIRPGDDFADTSMRHLQLATDFARPHALLGQLDNSLAGLGRQRSPVDELTAELVQRGGRARTHLFPIGLAVRRGHRRRRRSLCLAMLGQPKFVVVIELCFVRASLPASAGSVGGRARYRRRRARVFLVTRTVHLLALEMGVLSYGSSYSLYCSGTVDEFTSSSSFSPVSSSFLHASSLHRV
ncbi:hypothetical protein BpHYR1_019468 [Brachionus plicatilis]|uniref:Uncharacterized protein n=1 Tax=Brachionus plicatilis TaxID=10195 RepID=A0A3M7RBT8_BRAPC|nr:hypothetical protein BpHYR1_019468 [Brachionus plicatilis]